MTRKRETPDRMIERCCKYILLLWTMSFCAHEVWAGPQSIRQLPNLTIHRFAQDKVGYIWIATDNGLCRYNGQFYYYYQNEPEDPASLPRQPGVRHSQRRKRHAVDRHLRRGLHHDARLDNFRRLPGTGAEQSGVQRGIRRLLRPRRDDALRRQRPSAHREADTPGTGPRCSKPI